MSEVIRNCPNCDHFGSDGDGPEYNGSRPVCYCEGLDRYIYVLEWFTSINNCFFKILARIDYGYRLVTITYKYNDSRSLPKYSNFEIRAIASGLKTYKYYGDSGEYMVTFKCEVENVSDINYFIL